MPDARPSHHRQPFSGQHLFRIVIAGAVAAFAAGYVSADVQHAADQWFSGVAVSVAAVLLIVWVAEIRVMRKLARIEARMGERFDAIDSRLERRLTREEYWRLYSDIITDLSGGSDGENTLDSGARRQPPQDQ